MTPPIDATSCRRMSYNYVFSTFDTRPIANRAVQRGMPAAGRVRSAAPPARRSEEHTSELQSLMRISYAVFCLKKKKDTIEFDNRKQSKTITQRISLHTNHIYKK